VRASSDPVGALEGVILPIPDRDRFSGADRAPTVPAPLVAQRLLWSLAREAEGRKPLIMADSDPE